MTDIQKIDTYIQKHSKWTEQLEQLRLVFQQTEMKEEVKWGTPTYTVNGKLVAGITAFKNHYALWFHQGVFLKDVKKKLVNAQEGTTRGMRQWRFTEGDIIEVDLVLDYLQESIENSLTGKKIKPQRKIGVEIPVFLNSAFQSNSEFKTAFEALTPGKQREYVRHITTAKQEKTKQNRLKKMIPMILENKGLHDKYKNC
ncbi:MAG: YdeI/OmpD-associated family protein [Flavobacteriaceae bacterium]|nr:YdeI/OmpD-associated family protein [Flavobacteriaceae bacterium]